MGILHHIPIDRFAAPRLAATVRSFLGALALLPLFAFLLSLSPARLAAQASSTWSPVGSPALPARLTAIVGDPRASTTVLVASPGGGIWRSDDAGINWSALAETTATLRFCSLTRDPSNADILYAGTGDYADPAADQGVVRSSDGGRSWNASLPFSGAPVCALAVDPTDGRRVAAGSAQGLYLSADSGVSWKRLLVGAFTSVAFDAQGKLYAARLGLSDLSASPLGGRATLLLTSANGGATFSTVVLPETANSPGSVTTHVALLARAAEVYAAVAYRPSDGSEPTVDVYRSADSGGTWAVAAAVGAAAPPLQLAGESSGARLFLASGEGLLSSGNRGQGWARLTTLKKGHHAVMVTSTAVWMAGDFGPEWLPLNNGNAFPVAPPPTPHFVDIAATSLSDIFAAGPTGVFRQDGTNQLWSTLLTGEAASGVVAGSTGANGQRTVLASVGTKIYRSTTGGTAMTAVNVLADSEVRGNAPQLLADPGTLANVYLAGQQLYRSTDQGVTFQTFANIDPDRTHVVTAIAAAPSARRFMYAATACVPQLTGSATCPAVSFIWRSTNSGQSWVQAAPVTGWVYQLAVDTRQTATVYAAVGAPPFASSLSSDFGDVVRSTDNATSWTSLRSNLPRGSFHSIGVDTTAPAFGNNPVQNLYAGGDKGVFLTFNGGTQWVALNSGLPRTPVAVIRQAGSDGLIAGTLGRGAYNARIAGLTASLVANPLELSAAVPPGGAADLAISLTNVLTSAVNWSVTATALTPGNWLSLSPGGGSSTGGVVEPRAATALSVHLDATGLAAGTYLGQLLLTSAAPGGATVPQSIPVILRVETTSYILSAVSPTTQTGAVGTSLPALVVALRDEDGLPVPGETISFAITGGGTLSRRSMTTLSDGTANTILTLPTVAGSTTVTATYRDQSVQFTVQAAQIARPSLQAGSVVSAATFLSGASLAPGQIVSIFGQNLASGTQTASSLPLPTTLGNSPASTRALLNVNGADVALPLFYVSPGQVNAVLPYDLAPGSYSFTVEAGGVRGNDILLTVGSFAPGVFTLNGSGTGAGIFLKADGSLITAANAATRGSVVSFYAVGLGAVQPALSAGAPGRLTDPLNRTTTAPRVFFDNLEGTISYSGLAPGFAGLYQINVQVPAGLSPASNIPVSLSIGGVTGNRVTIPVQ